MRGRSYDYSPSPPRGYGRRHRNPSPKGRYGSRGRDLPTSLLVRNLRHDCRPEDLRRLFGRFGPLKDIYLPRDYYTGEPRGFGFVQYLESADAADAKHHLDGEILLGRELTVVFAEENRKKPAEMRQRDPVRGSRSYDRSHSPSLRYGRSYSRSPVYSPSPRGRHYSRSISPRDRRYRHHSYSRSPHGSRSYSRSPIRSRSPYGSRSYSRSPVRSRSRSLSLEYSR
ncbi:SERINE/ARGININE-RICH SC35-LIKE SPLICING FACTOR SCL30A [Salix purpurea]|uniref:SERINE/ARGININE-RICH SC35-LIKE SPLICING FACTOR SCL30A n=1 Tax=Salix purpurea TaxID=77065 RepID=A0A9Q0T2S4_SALPP|nr:SERINE/ARGININE-RICH SC35-LIKE SPLICING FACTOR SCL30A [Salix purpurea]